MSSDDPLLWFLNRATGSVLLILFTLVVVLGVLATRGRAGTRVPRFVPQTLHRDLGLLASALLLAHVVTAVVDTFVDIRWWQALWPFGATYQPLWLGLGTLAFDLVLVIVATSLLRGRLGHRGWRVIHVSAYAAWVASVAHGLGIGTDSGATWSQVLTWSCVAAVVLAVVVRLSAVVRPAPEVVS